jgi:DNA-binding SARP family transcriptional activator/tetratricopeptide (TPR) repeat protein
MVHALCIDKSQVMLEMCRCGLRRTFGKPWAGVGGMVRFRLLGEVSVTADDQPVDIGHARQRAVLAVLLLEANRAVPADTLIDRVWGDRLPRQPREALYGYLSRLRATVPIDRTPAGYVLTADPLTVDVHRFRELAARARATEDDEDALATLDAALALWRGEPFTGLDSRWLGEVRDDLERRRRAVELDRNDIRLRLGLHDLVLADTHPHATTDERLAGQVMLALHRGGRQADALRYFEQVRLRLAEELGVDPGSALCAVQYRVLSTDTALGAVPRQLPASPPSFSGRARELARLGDLLATAPVVVITGGGGMGKTWLALRWAHDNVDRFPDGQLYVNLRGFDPAGEPVSAETAVRGLLDGLGAEPTALPAGLEAQSALYRSMIADRRVLVILDNAVDTAQVTPLLPGSASCAVLVTSRRRLTGLVAAHGANPLALPVLTDAEAGDLLTQRLGHGRTAAEPGAVREIIGYCAGLPLALGTIAARAAAGSSLAALAEELRVACLDALDTEELTANLRAVFSVSYTPLDEDTARAFRLLASAPGADISREAATHLLAPGNARQVLRRLTATHLVQEHQPGRFRMHDLVRRYAVELARASDSLTPLMNYYTHAASAAMDRFAPVETYRRPAVVEPVCPSPRFPSLEEARDWLDAERANLVAAGADDSTGRLAMTLFRYLDAGAHYHDALALHTRAVDATSPDQPEHGYALLHRATVLTNLGQAAEACSQYEMALRQAEAHHDTVLEACAATGLAGAHQERGVDQEALECYERALALARRHGHRHHESVVLNNLGDFYCAVGRYADASDVLNQGLDITRELRDLPLAAYLLANLGDVYRCIGEKRKAVEQLRRALRLARELRIRGLEIGILIDLGKTTGSPDYYRQALAIAHEVGSHAQETRARECLSRL